MSDIELWQKKKLLKTLRDAKGNGTSMISLIIPPKDQLSKVNKMLVDEYGTASNIKSRVNKQSVLGAITSAQHKLKCYARVPPNGLAIFVGTLDGDRRVSYGIEPVKPINTSLYLCDSRFHVEDLLRQFEDESCYGFVVMDGSGCLFATLSGGTKNILQTISVDLPKKHGRGGQSALRFARLRMEKRYNYVKKVAELCNTLFAREEGYVFAGAADFKNELRACDILLPRIRDKIIKVVDTNYGGENGLNQAIDMTKDVLKDLKLTKEKEVLQRFFLEIATNTHKYVFGPETIRYLEMQVIDTLIVCEEIDLLHNDEPFIDFIADHYKEMNINLHFVSSRTPEGEQFVQGFGGIGGILRYRMVDENEEEYESVSESDLF